MANQWRACGASRLAYPKPCYCCAVAGYVVGANRIRLVDYPRLHPLRGTRIAHINVGPTKVVGVGPTARREREDTYAGTGAVASPRMVHFNHGLAEVFTALTDAGLSVTTYEEHREAPWNPLGEVMMPSRISRLNSSSPKIAIGFR